MFPKNDVEAFLATASTLQTRPMTGSRFRSTCRVRSGLTAFQLFPRSSLRKIRCAANQSRVGEWGEMISGESQFQRSGASPGPACGWMSTCSPVFRSNLTRAPCCASE